MAIERKDTIGFIVAFLLIHIVLAFIPGLSQYSLFKMGFGNVSWIAVVIILVLLIGWASVSTYVRKTEGRASFAKDGGSFVWNGIKNWIRHLPGPVGWVINRIQWRDSRAQYPFHRLRYELNVLINYLLRLQVYISKSNFVEQVQNFVIEEIDEKFQTTFSPGQQKSDYIEYASGYDYKQREDSSWYKVDRVVEFVSRSGSLSAKVPGGAGARNRYVVVCKLMDMLKEELNQVVKGEYDLTKNLSVDAARVILELSLASVFKQLEDNWRRTKTASMRYGLTQYKDSLRWAILDMNNVNGWYKHPYKFASSSSRPYIVTARIKKKDGKIVFGEEIKKEQSLGEIKTEISGSLGQQQLILWEVDNKGRFIDDINKIRVENKHMGNNDVKDPHYVDLPKLREGESTEARYRKIDPEEVYHGDELKEIASLMASSEWEFFKQDFLTGYLHPKSRIWKDYQEAHNRRDWNYSVLKSMGTPKLSSGNAAFDREALKDPSTIQYKGRINYYDMKPELVRDKEPINKYPCVSLLGLTNYIVDYVSKTLSEEEQIKFFRLYPQYRHDFGTGKGKFGVLGEEVKKEG